MEIRLFRYMCGVAEREREAGKSKVQIMKNKRKKNVHTNLIQKKMVTIIITIFAYVPSSSTPNSEVTKCAVIQSSNILFVA